MDDDGIVWQEPPPKQSKGRTVWAERLEPFIANPERWGIVMTFANANGLSNIKRHFKAGTMRLPEGTTYDDFDWTLRKNDQGKFDLYVRHMPQRIRAVG